MQDVKLYTKCMSVGLRISDSRWEWVQSGVIFNPENIFFKWCGSHLTVMHIQLPNCDLGLWDYLGFKSISYYTKCYIGGEGKVHNCCVDWASRIVK